MKTDRVTELVNRLRNMELAACRESADMIELFANALVAVNDVIGNSHGVAGLHANGDVATWQELLAGGRNEGWLQKFDAAMDVVKDKIHAE